MSDADEQEKGLSLVRMAEALVFASSEPVSVKALEERLPEGANIAAVVQELAAHYGARGVQLVKLGEAYAFRTAPDLAFLCAREEESKRKLSRAAQEVLAIIAYHQPVTRAELEEIRGVEPARGTLDLLLETGWVKIRGRRRVPGRPVTYGTTQDFLDHFNLSAIGDLPGMEELKGAGLLSARIPAHFSIAPPSAQADELSDEEEPLEADDLEELGLFTPRDGEK
ncbi:MAG: Chromosome segregation and condensation protein ScpB [Candidatus Tokpelaia hoelldobleri]|uniref:Chromosome segregation and condensation protein ScpB n=1 Tax=Candidatus Tokpelaia hoelldobleri TaxID=1902579 RepID=A0A1U9JU59_9HYPH|nr:MAG: Chromosome segregation and condensation protein ScpB [Candidatus Tokpelaia hoelldoblerii]